VGVTTGRTIAVRAGIALLVALAIAVAFRLGDGRDDHANGPPPSDARAGPFVSAADFRDLPPSSPGVTVLRWWQDIQFGKPTRTLVSYYAPENRPPARRLASDLRTVRYIFRESRPLVLDQRVNGSTAEVFTVIPGARQSVGKGGTPYLFKLVRQGGSWKLVSNFIGERAAADRQIVTEERSK
jgi:hypothetical protein